MPVSKQTQNLKSKKRQSRLPLYISLGILIGLVLLYFFNPSAKAFFQEFWVAFTSGNEGAAEAWVSQFGYWGPVIVVVVMVVQMFLIVIPSPLLMVMAILSYGPIWGSLILVAAVFCASTVGYIVGKYFHKDAERLLGEKAVHKMTSFIDHYGIWAVILIKFSPFLSNDAVSFVAGILKMGYWKFIGASLLGSLPLIALIAYLRKNYATMGQGLLWVSVGSLLLFVGFIWWDKKKRIPEKHVD